MSDYSRHSSVSSTLSYLDWDTLKKRRDIQLLCVFYKIINGLIDVSLPECVTVNLLITRGHNKRFTCISTSVDSYKHSLFPRIIPKWNSFTSEAINAPTFKQFTLHLHN